MKYVTTAQYAKQVQQAKQFLQGKTTSIQQDLATEMQALSEAQAYEKAAVIRDRLKALHTVQSQQRAGTAHERCTDLFAVYKQGGYSCVQVFFFRHGCHYGHRAYFPRHDAAVDEATILASFIPQFYQNRDIPEKIYVSHALEDHALLEKALQEQSGAALNIKHPKRGQATQLMTMALTNAHEALTRKLNESSSYRGFLKKLATYFNLDKLQRIEVYDNSHLFGTNPYGAMIVAGEEGFEKNAYRKYMIRAPAGAAGDDYGMLRDVFLRRFQKLSPENRPDFIIVDGGKGQLNVAQQVLRELDLVIPMIGMGKGPNRNAGEEHIYEVGKAPYQLAKNDPVLFILQRLRDEAHRFAIGTHRMGRQKQSQGSTLDHVPGIGPKRRRQLLQHFGAVKYIQMAAIKELEKVEGISHSMAKIIYDYFH